MQLYKFIHALAPKTGLIFRISEEGEVQETLWDIYGEVVAEVSSVLDMGDRLYLGSCTAPYLGRLDYTAASQ